MQDNRRTEGLSQSTREADVLIEAKENMEGAAEGESHRYQQWPHEQLQEGLWCVFFLSLLHSCIYVISSFFLLHIIILYMSYWKSTLKFSV